MNDVVKFLFSSLQNSPFDVLKNFDDYCEFLCIDVKDIGFKKNKNGEKKRDYAGSSLRKIRGHGGAIFIFFNPEEKEDKVLLVGYSEDLYPEKGSDNPAIKFSRYIINQNEPMKKYFDGYLKKNPNIPQATNDEKEQAFIEYINKYSILLVCLRISSSASLSLESALKEVVKGLNSLLKPKIKDK